MFARLRLIPALFCVLILGSMAAGCATTDGSQNDPYESFNRQMFDLNEKADKYVALPLAKGYVATVPQPGRDAVHNVLVNLAVPVTFANDILQGHPKSAVQTLGRAIVNTTIGVGGISDVATPMGIAAHDADFGETLALYGAKEGPYLVLPLLGPSNPRDAIGNVVDIAFDPFTYIGLPEKSVWTAGRRVSELMDERSRNIEALDQIRRSSVDLYATLRSLYRQHRDAQIRGGKPDMQNLPDI